MLRTGVIAAVLAALLAAAAAPAAAQAFAALRRQGHPRRRPAAHRARHGVQLPAGEGRRHHRRARRRRRRCARSTPPASSRTCAWRPRTTCWWCSCGSARPSRRSTSRACRSSSPTTCARRCASSAWPRGASSTARSLENAEKELKRQYLSRGLYGAEVQTTVTPLERNRVGINIAVTEGEIGEDPRHQHRRRQRFPRRGAARPVRAAHPGLAHLVHQARPATRASAWPPTWRRCARSTRTAATSTSASIPRRCRSRPTGATSTSPST